VIWLEGFTNYEIIIFACPKLEELIGMISVAGFTELLTVQP
jgi:hypothetical protein